MKKILSFALTLALVLGLFVGFPMTAQAAPGTLIDFSSVVAPSINANDALRASTAGTLVLCVSDDLTAALNFDVSYAGGPGTITFTPALNPGAEITAVTLTGNRGVTNAVIAANKRSFTVTVDATLPTSFTAEQFTFTVEDTAALAIETYTMQIYSTVNFYITAPAGATIYISDGDNRNQQSGVDETDPQIIANSTVGLAVNVGSGSRLVAASRDGVGGNHDTRIRFVIVPADPTHGVLPFMIGGVDYSSQLRKVGDLYVLYLGGDGTTIVDSKFYDNTYAVVGYIPHGISYVPGGVLPTTQQPTTTTPVQQVAPKNNASTLAKVKVMDGKKAYTTLPKDESFTFTTIGGKNGKFLVVSLSGGSYGTVDMSKCEGTFSTISVMATVTSSTYTYDDMSTKSANRVEKLAKGDTVMIVGFYKGWAITEDGNYIPLSKVKLEVV